MITIAHQREALVTVQPPGSRSHKPKIVRLSPHRTKIQRGAERLGQIRPPHQPLVHGAGALAAFADGPDRQGLAAARVAGGEYVGDGGMVDIGAFGRVLDIAAPVELDAPNKTGVLFCPRGLNPVTPPVWLQTPFAQLGCHAGIWLDAGRRDSRVTLVHRPLFRTL